jgi:L-alanine-DL-glutamate epimerase-like enolase superfamily enzyme
MGQSDASGAAPNMKITRVEPIHVSIPFEHGAPLPSEGLGARGMLDIVFIRIDTDAGVTGWGEAFGHAATPVTIAAIDRVIAPLALGRDPSDIAALMHDLWFRLKGMSRNGPVAFALSGLDIALWDIKGKVEGAPIWRLLGGPGKPRVPAYASLLRLGADHVGKVAADAQARGYRAIKLHEHSVEAVKAARAALGRDIPLMLDTNCHWPSVPDARAAAQALRPYDLAWLEEPLYPPDDFEGLARLRREAGVPIAAGENLGNRMDLRRICDAQAVDVVQPSLAKMGGISEMMKAVKDSRDRDMRLVPHSPYSGPGLIAALHVIAAMPGEVLCEHRYGDLAVRPLGGWTEAEDGFLRVPDGPGLGVDPDLGAVARYRVA